MLTRNQRRSVLPSWQILALAVSGIIGVTIWQGTGLVLHVAGPAGLLTAVGFVALTCISVMESLSEMVMLWPVSMGLYEYVRAFVDHDLAIVIALAYWSEPIFIRPLSVEADMTTGTHGPLFSEPWLLLQQILRPTGRRFGTRRCGKRCCSISSVQYSC